MTDVRAYFDADAMAAALEEPTLVVDRYRYRGRVLSLLEWLPFWERQQDLDERAAAATTAPAVAALLRAKAALHRDFLRVLFPRRRYTFWAPDPVKALAAAPGQALEAAYQRFFIHQARALRMLKEETTTETAATATPGTDSAAPTTAPAPAARAG